MKHYREWKDQGYIKFQRFQELMQFRIKEILLVSSLYDLYLFEEDGRLYELIRNEYQELRLSQAPPEITRVSSGKEAINLLQKNKKFDLVITTLHTEDMNPLIFAKKVKDAGIKTPVILLSFDNKELQELIIKKDTSVFEKIFIWNGDYRLIIGIVKYIEDKMNVEHDTNTIGVKSIILIEDNIHSYSSFIPMIYTELISQSKRLVSEGINISHKYLRLRARPKILLCSSYEEAEFYINKYKDNILGIISDIDFIKNGKQDPQAGLKFARQVRKKYSDIPILLQSADSENFNKAKKENVEFLYKNSPTLLQDLRNFMIEYFSFGDFIFRTKDGKEIARANDLISFEEKLKVIPEESIRYHGERNHFSNWLKARTEFWLADKLRPQKVTEFESIEKLREYLINALKDYRRIRQKGIVTDFKKETFDPQYSFARIGGGSLGGKARGLSFLNYLINNFGITDKFDNIKIDVPPGVVIGTEIFDQFIDLNNLREFILNCNDDIEIRRKFLKSKIFPDYALKSLTEFLELINEPLSVRSSSLLEDSQYHPFAGVYDTFMIPNNESKIEERLESLINTIKLVYASTFYNNAKDYFRMTSYRYEEEKMAVIVQKLVGRRHNNRFYPDFSGTAKTYNFYPIPPQKSSEGIVDVALGLGKTIVDGGNTVRFSPKYPENLIQFYSTESFLENNQSSFFALDMDSKMRISDENLSIHEDIYIKKYDLTTAEVDGTLQNIASTYSPENDRIYDDIFREGYRVITFAPILKFKLFPLPEIINTLLEIGTWGMGTPVEIEFAVSYYDEKKEFGLLQMRPYVINEDIEEIKIEDYKTDQILCKTNEVLGTGSIDNIYDIIYVDYDKFDRAKTKEIAREVSFFNNTLREENLKYLLVGYGRWGSLDPWLGIPVVWSNISNAKVIVEADFKDLIVDPSQGSHFFQNLTSFSIAYFTVKTYNKNSYIDIEWLRNTKCMNEMKYVNHIRLSTPLIIKMNSHKKKGIIIKPN